MDNLISLCIPCHNRTHDLKRVMPYLIAAANYSPPVEIVVVDYNSQDDLRQFMMQTLQSPLEGGNIITYKPYHGRDHYHMAHARNLSVVASTGEYFVISSTDIYFHPVFFQAIRDEIDFHGYTWMYEPRYKGVIACLRDEFMDAGGYDERFEFYGPEDRELHARLVRRGGKHGVLPPGLVSVFPTPNEQKVQNYRLALTKREMHIRGKAILDENNDAELLVANPDGWGKWT